MYVYVYVRMFVFICTQGAWIVMVRANEKGQETLGGHSNSYTRPGTVF